MSYRVCSSNDVKENSTMVVRIGRNDIVIGRRGGRLFAFDNSCPHRGASLSKGELKGDNIICYMHGYEYKYFYWETRTHDIMEERCRMDRTVSGVAKIR